MKLSFHGGAREVTGAAHLIESGPTKILIDCGLFQGSQDCDELNFQPFRFMPAEIAAVIVTHAHLDHVGRIPKLIRDGFSGAIYSTPATRELAAFILEDALSLSERRGNELYGAGDIAGAMARWKPLAYREPVEIGGVEFMLRDAGHILGSALVELWAEDKHFLFSGDLGNVPSVLLPPPEVPKDIEYMVVESAYGSRVHESAEERVLKLERAVEDAAARAGTLLVPAFATERTQDILHLLNEMVHQRRVPVMPMFVDSPLAIRITGVYDKYASSYRDDIRALLREHPHLFQFRRLRFTPSVEESKSINDVPPPKVVIAGSGMMSGGRILHHARRYLADPKSILLMIGYQAGGSLGRRLIDGEKLVKILGEEVRVVCEVRKINGFSAHADNPQLFSFVERNRDTLKRVFVVQGEEAQALYLAQEIKDRLGIQADAPTMYDTVEL
ncbi:MAG: MBL fold metallo-hydrolase [Candidatus Sungbacteria bacterium]|uniref:MBL fold metallo-hydrolase n=1 Tax=Candidatus Sungiibacteriota bacterium TaxID=2750080 RepID=A0A932VR65_9BACT|nr:MBL fold metallo-hydrolase [Candidatus Sungbacteria bacterium]